MNYLLNNFKPLINIDLSFNQSLNDKIKQILTSNKKLGSADRYILKELGFTYFRNKLLIDELRKQHKEIDKFALCLYLWDVPGNLEGRKLKSSKILKDSIEHLAIGEKITGLLNKCKDLSENYYNLLRFSLDEYFLDNLKKIAPTDSFSILLNKLHTFAPTSVRFVNHNTPQKLTEDFSKSKLFNNSYQTQIKLDLNFLLQNGAIIQDDSSRYIANICNPKPNMKVLDACSGAGGKAIALSYLTDHRAQIIAFDKDKSKLTELQKRVKNLGLQNIFTVNQSTLDKMEATFDIVLVDAPCTGIGTIRRFPEKKYTVTKQLAASFNNKQFDILTKYSKFVNDNGKLVYATCSFLEEENQAVVAKFISSSDFKPVDINSDIAKNDLQFKLPSNKHEINLLPIDFDGDAFFAACFSK